MVEEIKGPDFKPCIGTIDTEGPDGNAHAIMGLATKALRKAGANDEYVRDFQRKCFDSGGYEKLKAIVAEHVRVNFR